MGTVTPIVSPLSKALRKANINGSIYSAILTPQGKYLYEFFITKSSGSYLLDCEMEITEELIRHLNLSPRRHSKYLVGMSKVASLVYV